MHPRGRFGIALALAALLAGCGATGVNHLELPGTTFEVVATIPVPDNPHGICFSPDGSLAYVACAGADQIAVIDTTTNQLVRTLPAGSVPLDVFLAPGGSSLIATQFQSDSLVRIPLDGAEPQPLTTLSSGPSLFSPQPINARRYLVCEFADVVYRINPAGRAEQSWATAGAPYPADIAPDGILLYVPARTDGVVTVIDTLNNTRVATVPVGEHPEGGAVTPDNTDYIVCSGQSNELTWINTATWTVETVLSAGVGPRPFSITIADDGRWGLVNNAGGSTVSIIDLDRRAAVGQLAVGKLPIVIRAHPDGRRFFVSCEGDQVVNVIERRDPPIPADAPKTQVIVMGMIHSGHRTSTRYSLDVVRNLIRAINPDDVCAEIPPNRLAVAQQQFAESGRITESRVKVFPEYVDVLFPLTREMDFNIIPSAGWTKEMNDFRRKRLNSISQDPAWASQWAQDQAAEAQLEKTLDALGPDDDPRMIHSDAYDRAIDQAYGGPYNEYFNDELGPGGWDNINALHYRLIARHLDRIKGQGRRVLITFGAGHKGWLLKHLKQRDDVQLLDLAPFLDQIESARSAP